VLRGDQENVSLWILRGHCYYELEDFAEASKCYEVVLRLPPGEENRHLVYLRFGLMAMKGESPDPDEAKRIFLYGIQKYPTPALWMAAGNACYVMEDLEEAEHAFAEANRLDPNNPLTWANLSLINLALGRKALAEQSYKWAMRFGLNDEKLIAEIQRLQTEKGFGDPSFPRIPSCIPHDYYVRRLGRQNPFDIYKDALLHEAPNMGKKRFDNTERENALRDKLQGRTPSQELLLDEQTQPEAAETTDEATDPVNIEPEPEIEAVPETELVEIPSASTASSAKRKKSRRNKSKAKRGAGGGGGARDFNSGRPSNPAEGERRKSPGTQERSRDSSKKMSSRKS